MSIIPPVIVRALALTGIIAVIAGGGLMSRAVVAQQQYDAGLYSDLRWRMIGPFRAGKVNAVAGVPGNPGVYYFAADGGGIWKTTDGGVVWKPIFDKEPVASIGAISSCLPLH